MLGRMITGMLLKAVLSLGVLVGIASYGQYLAGGDPGALWRAIGDRTVGALARSAEGVGERVGGSIGQIGEAVGGSGDGEVVRVWTWRDAQGVTHYASAPPPGVDARPLAVDPDVNVVAAPRPSPRSPSAANGSGAAADAAALPGIAGALQRVGGGAPATDADEAARLLGTLGGAAGR